VSAPLFLVGRGALDAAEPGSTVELAGPEGRHAVQVRRVRAGESIHLADGAGTRIDGVVRRVRSGRGEAGPAAVEVEVVAREHEPAADPRFVLVQALAKGDRDLSAVETATELGVDEIVPWQAERSVVVWREDRAAKAHHRWAATVFAATKQARRAWVPEIGDLVSGEQLAARVARASLALALHEEAERPLGSVDLPPTGDVLVIVGPEGGITSGELDRLRGAGAVAVRLGSAVLRSSSAGPAALAVLSARRRWA
jgi:16S rRNA (uracil1498-N3)-methyltransferase